ncbi:MAG TPA: hypothetical protein V6D47_13615 [Oscillatoriaceae cyanobacterium]
MKLATRLRHTVLPLTCGVLGLVAAACSQSVTGPTTSTAHAVAPATPARAMFHVEAMTNDPPRVSTYTQDFERNFNQIMDWYAFDGSAFTNQAYQSRSGHPDPSNPDYAPGIDAAHASHFARLLLGPTETDGGGYNLNEGPYTHWGGYSAKFPKNGYQTQLDIYLDCTWAGSHAQVGETTPKNSTSKFFDWDSAINDTSGNFKRDFVFNAATYKGTYGSGFVISASENAFRANVDPSSTGRNAVHILTSGWYTFKHRFFHQVVGGTDILECSLTITDANGIVMGQWTLPNQAQGDTTDPISTVGGNRYGWFANQEIPNLPIDYARRVDNPGPND